MLSKPPDDRTHRDHQMHDQVIGSICQDYSERSDAEYALRRQAAQEAQLKAAHDAQFAHFAASRREKALEAALRTSLHDSGSDAVLEAAKAYEAYLKGE